MTRRQESFHHALAIDHGLCGGCTHCIAKCPTGAIRVRGGKATIRENWCVDCGECLKVCPAGAIYVEQNELDNILDYPVRVALVPAVFFAQFPEKYTERDIYSALYELGFTHVRHVESSVEVIREQMASDIAAATDKPSISPYCPAIVRLIQIRFPDLVDNIINIKPPVDATAVLCREQMREQGYADGEVGLFYITPCAAKIAALHSGEGRELINGVLNTDSLFNKVYRILQARGWDDDGKDYIDTESIPELSGNEMSWCQTSGEAENFDGRCFAVDEIHNVIEFIERMETTGELAEIDFLELRACDRGCVGGVLTPANRFLAAERLHKRAMAHPAETSLYNSASPESIRRLKDNIRTPKYAPMTKLIYPGDINEVLRKMNTAKRLLGILPGIDCGACGSPGCQSLAEDILRGEATFSSCIFMQREMERRGKMSGGEASDLLDEVWGKERIGKKN